MRITHVKGDVSTWEMKHITDLFQDEVTERKVNGKNYRRRDLVQGVLWEIIITQKYRNKGKISTRKRKVWVKKYK